MQDNLKDAFALRISKYEYELFCQIKTRIQKKVLDENTK